MKFRNMYLLVFFSVLFFVPNLAFGAVYYYCGKDAAGSADGSSWANQWDCELCDSNPVDASTVSASALTQPTYIFMDGGSTSQTYNGRFTLYESGFGQMEGSSDTNRIYIMPGYAASEMGVPGTHTGHTGQVIWDRQGSTTSCNGTYSDPGIFDLRWSQYITIDGYADPRLSEGNNPKLVMKDWNITNNSSISIHNTPYATIRNIEFYMTGSYHGDAIAGSADGTNIMSGVLIEYNYIHDGGTASPEYAAIWLGKKNAAIARYNEIRDWATTAGEGIAFLDGNVDCAAYNNLLINVGIGMTDIPFIRHNTFYMDGSNRTAIITRQGDTDAAMYIENNIFYLWGSNNSLISLGQAGNLISDTFPVYINANVFYDSAGYDWFVRINRVSGGPYYQTVAGLNGNSDSYLYIQSNNLVGASNYLVNPPTDMDLTSNATNAIDGAYETNWSPTQDFHGAAQSGTAWDIGYDEFNSTDPIATDPPQPPTDLKLTMH